MSSDARWDTFGAPVQMGAISANPSSRRGSRRLPSMTDPRRLFAGNAPRCVRRAWRSSTSSGRHARLVSAVELRPEESRCRLQDLVRSAQLTILPLQLGDPRPLPASQPSTFTRLQFLLEHPPSQRLAMQAELGSDRGHSTIAEPSLRLPLAHQAHRPFAELRGNSLVVPWTPSFLHRMEPPRNPGRFTEQFNPYWVPHIAHQAQRAGVPPNAGSVARANGQRRPDCLLSRAHVAPRFGGRCSQAGAVGGGLPAPTGSRCGVAPVVSRRPNVALSHSVGCRLSSGGFRQRRRALDRTLTADERTVDRCGSVRPGCGCSTCRISGSVLAVEERLGSRSTWSGSMCVGVPGTGPRGYGSWGDWATGLGGYTMGA